MTTFDYIENYPSPQREIMLALHEMLASFPGVESRLRFQIPYYDRNRWLGYFIALANGGVELNFCQANRLSNEQGLLDFRGRTQVAGLVFFQLSDIPQAALMEIIQEAILVDDELGLPGKRSRNTPGTGF